MSIKNIKLCSIPELTNSIQNKTTIDFENYSQQLNFFNSRVIRTVDSNISIDGTRKTLNIPLNMEQIKSVDYCYIADEYGKVYFYFISEKKYITINSSQLTLDLDVFQTYLFDFELMESFIDRCHVNRWTSNGYPTSNNIVEEGLEFGEHIIKEEQKLFPLKSNYLIVSTNPLGTLGANTPPITDDEKEINREFGYNPSNPIPEWPVEEGGGGGGGTIPLPPESEGQVSENSLGTEDYNNLIFNGRYKLSTLSSSLVVYSQYPITAGEFGLSQTNSEEDFEQEIGKNYSYGTFFHTNSEQNVFCPIIKSIYENYNPIVRFIESGTGIPTSSVFKVASATYTPDKYLIKQDYGNYVVLRLGGDDNQYYIIIGFMKEPYVDTPGIPIKPNTIIGKTGDIPYKTGTKKGIYVKGFDYKQNKVFDVLQPYSKDLNWKGFKFGPGMFGKKPGNLEDFSTTNELFGDDVYIPCKVGNVGSKIYTNSLFINNLTSTQDVNTYLVAPANCTVDCVSMKFGDTIKPNYNNILYKYAQGSDGSDVFNYIVLKFSSTLKLVIVGLSFYNVKQGDVLEKGDIIGSFRPHIYTNYKNNSYYTYQMQMTLFSPGSTTSTNFPYLQNYPAVGTSTTIPQWGLLTQEQLLEKDMKVLNDIYIEKIKEDYNLINNLKILNQDEPIE